MTKNEFLDKYGHVELFSTVFVVDDLESAIPDDAMINEDSVQSCINRIGKGFEAGIMADWDIVAQAAVDMSNLIKKD